MRLLHKNPHTEAVGHDGVEYERDEHGAFELPHELAESLLERFPHLWETAPDPVPAEPTKPKRGPKAKQEPVEETDPEQVEDPQVSDPADPKTEEIGRAHV